MSMAATATGRCRVWPTTLAQDVKCVRAHCHGAGSSRHPAIFPVVFGELIHSNVAQSSAISRTANLLLLRMTVLTLAIISSFLDFDGRPERVLLSTEVLPSLTLRLLMSYIYGAPSKAKNANVVYIWTYVWQL